MENKLIIVGANSYIAKKIIMHLKNNYEIIIFSRTKLKIKNIIQYTGDYNNISIINKLKKNISSNKIRPIFIFFNSLADKDLFINSKVKDIKKILNVNLVFPIVLTNLIINKFFYSRPIFIYMSSLRAKSYDKGITLYSTSKNSLSFFAKNLHKEYSKFKIIFKVILLGLFKGGLEKKLSNKIKKRIMANFKIKKYSKINYLVKIIEDIIKFPHKTNVEIDFVKASDNFKN